MFAHVKRIVADGASVLDIGCGTGRLAFQLTDKCSRIDAIDPSRKNVDIARAKLARRPDDKLMFHHVDALGFLSLNSIHYDYATISYVIHEIDERERGELFRALSAAADRIIVVDYMVPRPGHVRKIFDELVEFAAGTDHYRNFRSFIDGNGLTGLIERTGLGVLTELKSAKSSAHIVVAAGRDGVSRTAGAPYPAERRIQNN